MSIVFPPLLAADAPLLLLLLLELDPHAATPSVATSAQPVPIMRRTFTSSPSSTYTRLPEARRMVALYGAACNAADLVSPERFRREASEPLNSRDRTVLPLRTRRPANGAAETSPSASIV